MKPGTKHEMRDRIVIGRGAAASRPPRNVILLTALLGLVALMVFGQAEAQSQTAAEPAAGTPQSQLPANRRVAVPDDARVDSTSAPEMAIEEDAATGGAASASGETAAARPPAAATATAPAATDATAEEARALLELLRDDSVRARLIAELERIADFQTEGGATADAAGSVEPDAGAVPESGRGEHPALGTRIADLTMEAVDSAVTAVDRSWQGVASTWRRLQGFKRTDRAELIAILKEIGIVIAATIGALAALRLMARPLVRRIGRSVDPNRVLHSAMLAGGTLLLQTTLVAGALLVGLGIALFAFPPSGELTLYQTLFLQAFAVAQGISIVIRMLASPGSPNLRAVPLDDRAARYWTRQLSGIGQTLAYAELLIQPVVIDIVNIFTGRATSVAIFVLVLIWAFVLVFRHRREPAAYFARRAEEQGDDMTLKFMATVMRYWHFLLLPYFAVLFVSAVTSGGVVRPILGATLNIVAAFAVGSFTIAWLTRVTRGGIKLPGGISETLPMLEKRIDAFVPAFLRGLRFVIFLLWLTYSLHVLNVLDLWAWAESALGIDIASTLLSVLLILVFTFAFWLALMSWIDYRLTPRGGRIVTSRERTLLTLLRNASSIAILVIGAMFALSEIGINIAPLIASAGVLGLAIGFGAQKMVQDIITGVFIQFENAINVGDYIEAGGMGGTVEKLTIRSVSLRDVHGVLHLVPFSSVDSVSNYMKGFGYHVADMGIAYREDIDEAKALMLEAFAELKDDPDQGKEILGDLEWFGVQSLADSAVILRARIKTRPGWQWAAGRAYNERVKKKFDAAGVEIPFPQTTMWFGEAKAGPAPSAHVHVRQISDKNDAMPAPETEPARESDRADGEHEHRESSAPLPKGD